MIDLVAMLPQERCMLPSEAADRVTGVRQFNRFYTRQIGLLRQGMVGTPFSLTEGRVLYEIGRRGTTTAAALVADLTIDPGYLSRLLQGFISSGLVVSTRSATDRRQSILALTDRGREKFTTLDRRSQQEIGALLERLDDDEQRPTPSSCARTDRTISAGCSRATLRSTPGNTDGAPSLRCWSPGSSRISSAATTLPARAAGSPSLMARRRAP
jgi:DNA-binding MarR family transcriptional regulator